jgi:short-subunit dehydrogenase
MLTGARLAGASEVDVLICNAGTAAPLYFLESTMEGHRQQMDVNYFGCLNAVMATAPRMVAKCVRGTIVLVSSAVCFAGNRHAPRWQGGARAP